MDTARIAALRAQGCGWKKIAAQLGVGGGVGTVLRADKEARWRVQETLSNPPGRLTRASLSVPGEFAVVRRMPELAGLLLTL